MEPNTIQNNFNPEEALIILKSKFPFHLYKRNNYFMKRVEYYIKVYGKEKELTEEEYKILAQALRSVRTNVQ